MTVENIPIVATFLDSYLYFYRKHQKENGTEGGGRERGGEVEERSGKKLKMEEEKR